MKILLVLAASMISAALVVPTVSQGQSAGDKFTAATAVLDQPLLPARQA